jgi:predicted ester cyclase
MPRTDDVGDRDFADGDIAIVRLAMTKNQLATVYRSYIDCLNRQDWRRLGEFVEETVEYNGRGVGLAGYRAMLEGNYAEIPDLRFHLELLTVEPPRVAARLLFDCTPTAEFLGLPVDGKRVSFAENVFYEFEGEKIRRVWSIVDKGAIEAQIG